MDYKFPIINHIDDVLPHIEGRDEFVVADRGDFKVINYNVVLPDTFPPIKVTGGSAKMREERSLTNRMRRECRGLIFDRDGKIMSRPFHKFFNLNERDETQAHLIDLKKEHTIYEKMDGSMIRPIISGGRTRLATKMGLTDIAADAEKWILNHEYGDEMMFQLESFMLMGYTPIFEWVSPKNKIVVEYNKEDLILLAIRHNITGEYIVDDIVTEFTPVPGYGSVNDTIHDYVAKNRGREEREGDIIRFVDGHMIKVKNDWYVKLHKLMDDIRFEHKLISKILNNEIDDIVANLPEDEVTKIRDLEIKFWKGYTNKHNELVKLHAYAIDTFKTRREIAIDFIPTLDNKKDAGFIFSMIDGKNLDDLMFDNILAHTNTGTKWTECKKWLNM